MILVTTGTNAPPFDRLLREAENLGRYGPLVVQHGPSTIRPAGATCIDYVSFERFAELVRQARIVVTHAGVGSILITLMNGKRPFVVPRLARFGEHVDDHQLELAGRLAATGVVTLVDDPRDLDAAISEQMALDQPPALTEANELAADLGAYLKAVVRNGNMRSSVASTESVETR